MLHSLRLRLILVTAVLPMVTIAGAGLLIRDANAETFGNGPRFSYAAAAPWATEVALAPSSGGAFVVNGSVEGQAVDDRVRAFGADPEAMAVRAQALDTACLAPFTAALSHAPVGIRRLDESAVPIVYNAGRAGGDFIVAADAGLVPSFERERKDSLSSLNYKVAGVIGGAGLLCGLIGFVASQRILQPVTALTGAARRMEAGDLGQRVDYEGPDEIGQLSHAFNSMAAGLHRNETLRQTMTSDIAHELRTPLNNIAGFVDMLADGLVEPDARVLSTLQEETQLLVGLVDDLEQLSLGDAGRLTLEAEDTDAGAVVTRAVEAMAPRAAEHDIVLTADVPETFVVIDADASRLDQVLRNLLENALRHTPAGGAVAASVEDSTGEVQITVEDTGPGIAPEHLPNIFERFYRADPSRTRATGGSGLGLAIVRQIVEAHGGSVTAENREEGGARFTVRLPKRLEFPG